MARLSFNKVWLVLFLVCFLACIAIACFGLFSTYQAEKQIVVSEDVGIHISDEVRKVIETITQNTTTNHLLCIKGNVTEGPNRQYYLNLITLEQHGENVAAICPDSVAILKFNQHEYLGCEFEQHPTDSEMRQYYNQTETLKLDVCVTRWNGWVLKLDMNDILVSHWLWANRTVLMSVE